MRPGGHSVRGVDQQPSRVKKRTYVNAYKLKIGKCEICERKINGEKECCAFDLDHLDPKDGYRERSTGSTVATAAARNVVLLQGVPRSVPCLAVLGRCVRGAGLGLNLHLKQVPFVPVDSIQERSRADSLGGKDRDPLTVHFTEPAVLRNAVVDPVHKAVHVGDVVLAVVPETILGFVWFVSDVTTLKSPTFRPLRRVPFATNRPSPLLLSFFT